MMKLKKNQNRKQNPVQKPQKKIYIFLIKFVHESLIEKKNILWFLHHTGFVIENKQRLVFIICVFIVAVEVFFKLLFQSEAKTFLFIPEAKLRAEIISDFQPELRKLVIHTEGILYLYSVYFNVVIDV
jgi:hypothetical protein